MRELHECRPKESLQAVRRGCAHQSERKYCSEMSASACDPSFHRSIHLGCSEVSMAQVRNHAQPSTWAEKIIWNERVRMRTGRMLTCRDER
jgi:hypothetical protein